VLDNRLFVEDGTILTSAGIASGVDLALALIERRHGPRLAAAVAREMVVYIRRDGAHGQGSVYLDYRTHLHPGIHRVQDWLTAHPAERATLADLAQIAALSPRHLTRVFRRETGISVHDYATRLRLEMARNLLRDPGLTIEAVAGRCGFESARQLRRVWKSAFGGTPGAGRGASPG
jgi:transcriptional regulator GlxA family with amidase domain